MHPQYAKDPTFASLFVDEARLTARLRHPNIVPTLDIVEGGGHLLIVMDYVEGESLAGLLKLVREAGDRIPVAVACAIIHDLLLGLHEAHEAHDDDGSELGIIHRDVSPQNVIVGLDGLSRVLDFGVAKARSRVHHSNAGEIKGKIPYMPPEQLFGEDVDRRVDVYAAGVLLWEALVGERLFDSSSEEALVRRIDAGDVVAPSKKVDGISPELDALVMRALCKDADGRFPTALAMAEALSSITALPPRTEISAWMKRHCRPRSIPANAIGCSRDLTERVGASPDAIVAVLEHRMPTIASRPSIAPVAGSTRRMAPAVPSSRLTMIIGIAVFAVAGVLVGRAMRAERAYADGSHRNAPSASQGSEQATPAVPVAPAVTAAAVVAPADPAPVAAAPVAAPPTIGRSTHAAKSAPAAKAVEPKPAADTASAPAKPATCRLPYTVDAEGHRHYKVECL
jgi:serine/threonine-protein kinase